MNYWLSWAEGPDAIARDLFHIGTASGMDPLEALDRAEGSVVGWLPAWAHVPEIRD
jgi:hypothetical protein